MGAGSQASWLQDRLHAKSQSARAPSQPGPVPPLLFLGSRSWGHRPARVGARVQS